jgi:septal ring factor EnvC (AmiA/AmiB activator)
MIMKLLIIVNIAMVAAILLSLLVTYVCCKSVKLSDKLQSGVQSRIQIIDKLTTNLVHNKTVLDSMLASNKLDRSDYNKYLLALEYKSDAINKYVKDLNTRLDKYHIDNTPKFIIRTMLFSNKSIINKVLSTTPEYSKIYDWYIQYSQ